MLAIERLDVHYGRAHALQQVSLTLDRGVLAVVGRNGMGKTTLCNAITGLVRATGSIRFLGRELIGLPANRITRLGIGYVPQGRRVWPSLTVDEHLRLAARSSKGPWTVERAYRTFPRLAERKSNGGAELSGGEQQMLAIARALLLNPRLLVMDEPTEGLAPVIVQQVEAMLKSLVADGEIAVLLIEQNLGVAIAVADTVNVMVNGRIARSMPVTELAADRALQQRLLGVKAADEEEIAPEAQPEPASAEVRVFTVQRAEASELPASATERAVRGYTRWASVDVDRPIAPRCRAATGSDARSGSPRRRVPRRGQHGARRVCCGHVRHQGSRALLSAQLPREARPARGDRGPRHVGQAVGGDGASARSGALPSAGRARGVHRRARQRGDRDGARLRAFRRAPARPGRPDFRRRLGQHCARDAGDAAPAR